MAALMAACILGAADCTKVDPYCQAVLEAGKGAGGPGTSLAMAIVIARHGDRTPANILPDEGDISWDGCGAGRTDTVPGSKAAFAGFAYSPALAASPYAKGMWQGDCECCIIDY